MIGHETPKQVPEILLYRGKRIESYDKNELVEIVKALHGENERLFSSILKTGSLNLLCH
jgi:hypothetical protein